MESETAGDPKVSWCFAYRIEDLEGIYSRVPNFLSDSRSSRENRNAGNPATAGIFCEVELSGHDRNRTTSINYCPCRNELAVPDPITAATLNPDSL
jgi:hypothetical protein